MSRTAYLGRDVEDEQVAPFAVQDLARVDVKEEQPTHLGGHDDNFVRGIYLPSSQKPQMHTMVGGAGTCLCQPRSLSSPFFATIESSHYLHIAGLQYTSI